MAASLKLKVEEREILYYRKYMYKVSCIIPGAHYTYNVSTITEYKNKIDDLTHHTKRTPLFLPVDYGDIEFQNIDRLLKYINKFEKNAKGMMRREGRVVSFFSNDLNFLKKAPSVEPLVITEASLMPAGIKYFKRDVPASYRVYFKEGRVSSDIRNDILSYIEKNEDIQGSKALMHWLHRPLHWNHTWSSSNYYINYSETNQLTMMYLLFSEVIGKNYKLEKK
jgi:hypothetical protein